MTLDIRQFVTSSYRQNCYVVGNGAGEALIVDPGSDADGVAAIISDTGWTPLAVIGTHAHFDHMGAVDETMKRYDIPFYLHHADNPILRRMNLYKMVVEAGAGLTVPDVTHDLAEFGDGFGVGGFHMDVLETPGHTPGGVCFIVEGNIFTGDTVLPKGIGRTDLPGGDAAALAVSIEKLDGLSGELTAHPGHGPSMALGVLLQKARLAGTFEGNRG
ncbi:MAG: MBL fold metallo-hydrolase [Alphaproteobacteria bacterium]